MKRITFTHSNDLTVFERLRYEKSLEKGQVVVTGYEGILSCCFALESDIKEFVQNVSNLPEPPSKFAKDPKHDVDIKAVWEFPEPIVVKNEAELVGLFEKIYCKFESDEYCSFNVYSQLVTHEILGPETGKPIYVSRISPIAKLGEAKQVTVECNIDSFDGVKLDELPKNYRKIWKGKIMQYLSEADRKPIKMQVEEDGILVQWKYADALYVWDLMKRFQLDNY